MKVTRCTLRQTSRSTITVDYHLQIPFAFPLIDHTLFDIYLTFCPPFDTPLNSS